VITIEAHDRSCTCSYCVGDHRMHYGLNIPRAWKAWNSWWVIKFWPGWYIRWTNGWLRRTDSTVRPK
jgi:hypothetical protein